MKLVLAYVDGDDNWQEIDTGLGGEAVTREGQIEGDFVVPFSCRENVVDVLRILLADAQREDA